MGGAKKNVVILCVVRHFRHGSWGLKSSVASGVQDNEENGTRPPPPPASSCRRPHPRPPPPTPTPTHPRPPMPTHACTHAAGIAAFGCMRALNTLLGSCSGQPALIGQLEELLCPLLARMTGSEGQDIFEEVSRGAGKEVCVGRRAGRRGVWGGGATGTLNRNDVRRPRPHPHPALHACPAHAAHPPPSLPPLGCWSLPERAHVR